MQNKSKEHKPTMSFPQKSFAQDKAVEYPANWDVEKLRLNWLNHMQSLIQENETPIPLKRLRYQLEQSTVYLDIMQRWPRMNGSQRLQAWKILLEYSEQAVCDILPTCVQCGECCRKGSPTLHVEDLELLSQGKLSWNQLITLRKGEPVRSPAKEEIFFLLDERIKVREKSGTQECVFLDGSTDRCTIYIDRPMQCRAQACWDSTEAEQLTKQAYLTRRDIFADVELLLDVISEHHQRCSFVNLQNAFKQLQENGGSIDELLELMAYEDHFRHFFSQQFNIPDDTLDLVFGRSFSALAQIFGFRVEKEEDGTCLLVPDKLD